MGQSFSSNDLSGGVADGIPSTSYAYSPSNTFLLGADATYVDNSGQGGEVTPFLVQPAAAATPTIRCAPILISQSSAQGPPPQSLLCPIAGTSLVPGLYTLSFSHYASYFASTDDTGYAVFTRYEGSDTLSRIGDGYTLSFVDVIATTTTTTTVTSGSSATTTVTSGISEVAPTSTVVVPSSKATVTVYSSTVTKQAITRTTLSGLSTVVTKTAACTMKKCNQDNCYRAMSNNPTSASSFCSTYTQTTSLATPTYLSQCGGAASRVSSACTCFVTSSPKVPMKKLVEKGVYQADFGPPNLTYTGPPVAISTETDPASTVTSGPVPSKTTTDPNATATSGTSTITKTKAVTTTTTTSVSTVDKRTTSTTTVQPTTCTAANNMVG